MECNAVYFKNQVLVFWKKVEKLVAPKLEALPNYFTSQKTVIL